MKAVLLCATLFAGISPYAQQTTQIPVTIRVTDAFGAAIPHAQIQITPSAQGAPAKLEADSHGQLSINLQPGPYAVSVSADGFKTEGRQIQIGTQPGTLGAGQVVSVILTAAPGSVVQTADSLLLSGDQTSVSISPADFRALPHVTITVHNSHTDANETYSGVPMATLLAKISAPMGSELRGKAMTSYLIATGSDGYSVVLSLAEVDPAFHDNQAIVADARDGQPLGKNGPFQLIVPGDKRPARLVYNLVSITLQHAH